MHVHHPGLLLGTSVNFQNFQIDFGHYTYGTLHQSLLSSCLLTWLIEHDITRASSSLLKLPTSLCPEVTLFALCVTSLFALKPLFSLVANSEVSFRQLHLKWQGFPAVVASKFLLLPKTVVCRHCFSVSTFIFFPVFYFLLLV